MKYKVQMTRTVDIGQKERGEAPCRIKFRSFVDEIQSSND